MKLKMIFSLQFQMTRLEHLCVQYLVACIGHRNVLAALQNAARLKLDYIKVGNQGDTNVTFKMVK